MLNISQRLLAFCVFLLSLSACIHLSPQQPAPNQPGVLAGSLATGINPGKFDRIVVYGPLQVIVKNKPGMGFYQIQSTQNKPLSSIIRVYIKGNVLYIHTLNSGKSFKPTVAVDCLQVTLPQLNALAGHNAGKIFVDDLNTAHFILKADGQGFIELNGRATRLDASLLDESRLDARHLAVRTIFINTTGRSQADVQNVEGLSVLSTDKSDVYFHEDPEGWADYERQNGSTLRMKGIIPETVEPVAPEEDRYIK